MNAAKEFGKRANEGEIVIEKIMGFDRGSLISPNMPPKYAAPERFWNSTQM